MRFHIQDYNGSANLLNGRFNQEWLEIEASLNELRLQLKASDQADIAGNLIFNPVATNLHFEGALHPHGWSKVKIPANLSHYGKDIDFGKSNVLIEVQFSNYPFLANNTLRSEVFFREQLNFIGDTNNNLEVLLIITKAKRFPASNSTLNFEQAQLHLNGLNQHNIFNLPIRLIGLDIPDNVNQVEATITEYDRARHSRTVLDTNDCMVNVQECGNLGNIRLFR